MTKTRAVRSADLLHTVKDGPSCHFPGVLGVRSGLTAEQEAQVVEGFAQQYKSWAATWVTPELLALLPLVKVKP